MIKTITTCDICGKEGKVKNLQLPMYRTFDSTDGRTFYNEPVVCFSSIDICPECLQKCTNIYDERVIGGDIFIHINPILKSNYI